MQPCYGSVVAIGARPSRAVYQKVELEIELRSLLMGGGWRAYNPGGPRRRHLICVPSHQLLA